MKFIRENLFYLIVVTAVIVLGVVFLVADSSISDDVTAEIAARKEISDKLSRNAGAGNLVNPEIVAAEGNRVAMIVGEANVVLRQQREKNQLAYRVLLLPVVGPDGQTKMLQPAFPYDANMYKDYELAMKFVSVQRAAFQSQQQLLEPTHAPNAAEINVALGLLMARPTAIPAPSLGGGGDLSTLLLPKATDYATFEKAIAGRVYVDDATILAEVCLPDNLMAKPDPDVLWRRQYKLWVATDLIAAIKAANEEVLAALPYRQDHNVCNSPVKRWVSLHVSDMYSTKGGEMGSYTPPSAADTGGESRGAAPGGESGGAGPMRGPGAGPMRGPSAGPSRGPMGGGEGGGGGGGGFGGGGGGGGSPGATNLIGPSSDTVTQHYSDQEFDVVQYNFQVVMPTRHVPLLMRTLMQDRNHTVLTYSAQQAPRTGLYFYSNEPVMLVTFTCEAIFLTSWERDLVPSGFLRTLPGGVLRDKDKERLK
jgi:hypothetical protein